MGPKLMNCCRAEQMGTNEFGNMLNMIQILEEGRPPAKEARLECAQKACGTWQRRKS